MNELKATPQVFIIGNIKEALGFGTHPPFNPFQIQKDFTQNSR